MTIIKNKEKKDYTILSNKILRHPLIRWETKGLWAYLMSLPEDWEVSVAHLAKNFVTKRDGVLGMLNEMIEWGLCERVAIRDKGRFIKHEYHITSNLKERVPQPAEPEVAEPDPAKPTQQSTIDNKVKKETTNLAEAVVDFLDLNISEALKKKLMKTYSVLELDIAIKRTRAWKDRKNDAAALQAILKNPEEWNDNQHEDIVAKNEAFIKDIPEQSTPLCNFIKGPTYVEFYTHSQGGGTLIEKKDPKFIEKVKAGFEKYGIELKNVI
jgi:hypothetical protein